LLEGRRVTMGVFKQQGVYWIDYNVSGHRKRERRLGLINIKPPSPWMSWDLGLAVGKT
jgi:hypothetical protein